MKKLIFLLLALPCLNVSSYAQNERTALTQRVRGTILDKSLLTPIPGVIVQILDTEPVLHTISDENGNFTIENVPIGRHTVKISYLGYKEVQLPNVTVNTGKESILTLQMEEEIVAHQEVVVTGKKNSSQANNNLIQSSVVNMRTEDINRFAGSRQDPSRMASNYAGVAGGGDQRNDIIVRGNSPTGVLWRLEGVDIPNPNHFTFTGNTGGAFSILNNNLLANSDFLTGAFPAEYGNKTAAVFDVRLRNGNNEKRENTFQLGLNGIEFGTEGPISKKQGSSYLISYRFLSFEALSKLGVSIGASGIPQFQDLTFKVNVPTEKAGTFTLWGISGTSKIFLHEKNESTNPETKEDYYDSDFKSSMFATGISHNYNFSKNTTGKLILSTSASKIGINSTDRYKDGSSIDDFDHSNTTGQYLANYTLGHRFNSQHFVKAGVIYRQIYSNLYAKYFDHEDSAFVLGLDSKNKADMVQTFAHWQYRVSDRLTTNAGLYYQRFMLNNTQALEPRLSLAYQLAKNQRVTLASGLHSQTQDLYIYQYTAYDSTTSQYKQSNKNLDLTRSFHVVLGYQSDLSEHLRLKAETYYQHMYNVPVSMSHKDDASTFSTLNSGSSYNMSVADSLVNRGTGKNYGVELTLEQSFHHNFYFLTNVSLLHSTYTGADGVERNSAFNVGHVFNFLAGKEFHFDDQNRRVLSIDMKVTHSGGRRVTPVNEEESIKQDKAVYDYANAYGVQLPSYFRTDLKVSYTLNRAKTTHNIFVAADNVFNTQNVLTQDWDNDDKKVKTYYQLGLYPYLGYRVQF
jgi:hypothetical protein